MTKVDSLIPDEPLVVSPRRARILLDIGNTKLYELIDAGELESFKDGKARKITMSSIKQRINRLVERHSS